MTSAARQRVMPPSGSRVSTASTWSCPSPASASEEMHTTTYGGASSIRAGSTIVLIIVDRQALGPVPSAASGWAGPVSGKGPTNGSIPLATGVARTLHPDGAAVSRNSAGRRPAADPEVVDHLT